MTISRPPVGGTKPYGFLPPGHTPEVQAMLLNERRAAFVYDAARLAAIAAGAPVVPLPWIIRETEFRLQFLDVIRKQCGDSPCNSPEELHDSWALAYLQMGWIYSPDYSREARTHPDLVPYHQLGTLEKDKDAVFIELCKIARLYIREPDPKEKAAE